MSATGWFFVFLFLFTTQHIKLMDGIPVTAPLFVLLLPIMIATRRATIDRQLVAIFILASIALLYSYFLSEGGQTTFASTAYQIVLMMPFILVAKDAGPAEISTGKSFLHGFNSFMILAVFLGIVQITLAFSDDLFTVRDLLPQELLLEGFNTSNQVEMESGLVYRSNGFFFLEPSLFSQYLALAILFEMRTSRRIAVFVALSIGLVSSLSGTGLMLLAIGVALTAMRARSAKDIVLTVAPILLLIAGIIYFVPTLADRITEVGSDQDSSGYWRFGMPIVVIYSAYSTSLHNIFLGVGPGVAKNNLDTLLMAYSSGIGKILYEYGIVGSCGIIALYYQFGMKSCHQQWLVLCLLVYLLIVNCGVQTPIMLLSAFLLVFFAAPALHDAGAFSGPQKHIFSNPVGKNIELS